MAKRKVKADEPHEASSPPPKDRSEDRHDSTFMVRLPEEFRVQFDIHREKFFQEHRYRPPYTILVSQAVEEFLKRLGLWPPKKP